MKCWSCSFLATTAPLAETGVNVTPREEQEHKVISRLYMSAKSQAWIWQMKLE